MKDKLLEEYIKSLLTEIDYELVNVVEKEKYIVIKKENITKIITYSSEKSLLKNLKILIFELKMREEN